MKAPILDIEKLREDAERFIREAALDAIPGEEKHAAVVAKLSDRVDDLLTWGPGPIGRLAELVDGKVAQLLIGALVREIYGRIRDDL